MQMSSHNNSLLADDELANTAAESQNGISARSKVSGLLNGRRKAEDEGQGLLGLSGVRSPWVTVENWDGGGLGGGGGGEGNGAQKKKELASLAVLLLELSELLELLPLVGSASDRGTDGDSSTTLGPHTDGLLPEDALQRRGSGAGPEHLHPLQVQEACEAARGLLGLRGGREPHLARVQRAAPGGGQGQVVDAEQEEGPGAMGLHLLRRSSHWCVAVCFAGPQEPTQREGS
eukprot:scaffold1311_cov256-Pinguiococcus_pyrenoidosus.AAC.68